MSKRHLVAAVLLSCALLCPRSVWASDAESAGEGPGYWSDWRNIAGWSLIGAGTSALGLWIGAWVRVEEIQDDPELNLYRQMFPYSDDVCENARRSTGDLLADRIVDLCDEGQAWATVWNVTLPLWIVLWGTGAGFLIWHAVDPSPDDGAAASGGLQLAWSPYLSRTGGGIGFRGRF